MASAGAAADGTQQQTRRPADTPFKQQRLRAWQPIFTPHWVISCFVFIALVFIPIGALVIIESDKVIEIQQQYDHLPNISGCRWSRGSQYEAGTDCTSIQWTGAINNRVPQSGDWNDPTKCGMVANLKPYDPMTGEGCPRDWVKGALNNSALHQMYKMGSRNPNTGERECDPMCKDWKEFRITETMEQPVYMYYKLTSFYQNHRRYAKSRSDDQLAGGSVDVQEDCKPLLNPGSIGNNAWCREQFGGRDCNQVSVGYCHNANQQPDAITPALTINASNPATEICTDYCSDLCGDRTTGDFTYSACGLVSWSTFNDSFDIERCVSETNGVCTGGWAPVCLGEAFGPIHFGDGPYASQTSNERLNDTAPFDCEKSGIAWAADRDKKFKPPASSTDYGAKTLSYLGWNNVTVLKGYLWSGGPHGDRSILPYFLNGWYLFEPYHGIPAAIDQDFMVWMRTASLSTFRKLYRKITADLTPGLYRLNVKHRFDVSPFDGEKYVVLSTLSWIGGKNYFLGGAYITVGCLCLLLAIAFAARHFFWPTDRAKAMQSYNSQTAGK